MKQRPHEAIRTKLPLNLTSDDPSLEIFQSRINEGVAIAGVWLGLDTVWVDPPYGTFYSAFLRHGVPDELFSVLYENFFFWRDRDRG